MANARKKASRSRQLRDEPQNDNNVLAYPSKRRRAAAAQSVVGKIEYLTKAQANYRQMIESSTCTFGLGPAGTGKTYVAASYAVERLMRGECQRIIISRPAVEADGGMGFLPGEIDEKFAPYFAPVRRILASHLGSDSHVENLMRLGQIQIAPLAYIRGETFDNAVVLLDEAQNTTPKEMKTFLTRIGQYSQVIIDGDTDQVDIKGTSGLVDAVSRLDGLQQVSIMRFTEDDIVRSGFVKDVLKRYRSQDAFANVR